jgi:hypothetical protein
MNSGDFPNKTQETVCTKRNWVLSVFWDDDGLDVPATLPPGLASHLERCESCRDYASELRALTDQIRSLRQEDPPAGLQAVADARVISALASGALPVSTEELPEFEQEDRPPFWTSAAVKRYLGALAMAAAVALAVGVLEYRRALPTSSPGEGGSSSSVVVESHRAEAGEVPDEPGLDAPAEVLYGPILMAEEGSPEDGTTAHADRYRPRDHFEAATMEPSGSFQPATVVPLREPVHLNWQIRIDIPGPPYSTEESAVDER